MTNFNKAWFEIVKDNPIIALDALLAKCFGYFNVNDQPYVSMDYYVTSDYVQKKLHMDAGITTMTGVSTSPASLAYGAVFPYSAGLRTAISTW